MNQVRVELHCRTNIEKTRIKSKKKEKQVTANEQKEKAANKVCDALINCHKKKRGEQGGLAERLLWMGGNAVNSRRVPCKRLESGPS